MVKYFVCSDIHSFFTELQEALDKAGFDINDFEHHLIVCGDLFDRGPDAIKVYRFVKNLTTQNRMHYVYGNHEELLFDCMEEVKDHRYISPHHISNGTVDTVCQFTGINKYDLISGFFDDKDLKKMDEVLNFIKNKTVNYVKIGNYICTHGWIPCKTQMNMPTHYRKGRTYEYDPDWENGEWGYARWFNGMEMWARGIRVPGKTIIAGHWHTNYGHAHIHGACSEWGEDAIFEPFVDDGIIALDACTAYSHKVNVLVIDDDKIVE